MKQLSYREFLEGKFRFSPAVGFDVAADETNPALKQMTRDIARWMISGGRRAFFGDFGLHKTCTQLEVHRLHGAHGAGLRLQVLPLDVRHEFARDAAMFFTGEYSLRLKFIRSADEIDDERTIYLTNYETVRDGKLDPGLFEVAQLDEASVLRSYGSLTYQTFLTLFDQVRYRYVATATPSPNRYKELIHYAGYLGVMDTGQALTRFFQRNSEQANDLTIYPHMKREFFAWLHSWALFLQKPSDLGYSDDGYILPPLNIVYHEIASPAPVGKFDRDGQGKMLADASLSLPDQATEKRESITVRVDQLKAILARVPDEHVAIWSTLESERHAIQREIPDVVSVYGSQDPDERSDALIGFAEGRIKYLSTKPEIAGSGCNFQRHCHTAVFVGIDDRFNDFIQAIHRLQRFGQMHPVDVHIIHTEAERGIVDRNQRKWAEHVELRGEMSKIIREYGLSSTGFSHELRRSVGCARRELVGKRFTAVNNDSVEEYAAIDDNRFGMFLTSVPFGNHYEYSASYNDFGHNPDNAAFFAQMDFLTPQLHRTLKPGRVLAVHVKDRIRFGNVTGYGMPSVEPFHADCIAHYRAHGFIYFGMITIVTDVVRENNQTYRLSWSEQCKDGTKMGVGSPEYLLLFRKLPSDTSKGYADERVTKTKDEYPLARWQLDAHAFYRSSGNRLVSFEEIAAAPPDAIGRMFAQYSMSRVYDYEEHVRLGQILDERGVLPRTFMSIPPASHHEDVWHDVVRMRTLNGEQTRRGLENHICPLQIDVVDRAITRWSNPDDEISDPFAGLFTVPTRAVALGRRGHGVELKPEYFDDGARYLHAAEESIGVPTLFDLFSEPSEAAD